MNFYSIPADKFHCEEIEKAITEAIRKHLIAIDALTEKQVCDALKQAIACGDFTMYITPNGSQQVIYEPFKREQWYRARIYELEQLLEKSGTSLVE